MGFEIGRAVGGNMEERRWEQGGKGMVTGREGVGTGRGGGWSMEERRYEQGR